MINTKQTLHQITHLPVLHLLVFTLLLGWILVGDDQSIILICVQQLCGR